MSRHVVSSGRLLVLVAVVILVAATLGRAELASAQPALSVVYLDATNPASTELWVVAVDGSSKRVVGDLLGPGLRPLGLRDGLLAVADANNLLTVNLASGLTKRLAVGQRIQNAYVANASTVFYATHTGCGPVEPKTTIGRFNPVSETSERVVNDSQWPGAEVLWHNAGADDLTVAPRGCDPGISNIWIMNAKSGDAKQTIPVDGCGSAAMSPTGSQVVLSYDLCKLGGTDTFPDLRIYALPSGAMQELRFTKDAPSRRPFVYAPDGKRVAYGLALDRDSQNGGAASGGIWSLDTASLERTKLWQDQGQESWAIGWSPDGSKLLVASMQQENACTFSVLDVTSATATAIPSLTACGEKGTLVGFLAQP
jgi:hypothetical protein